MGIFNPGTGTGGDRAKAQRLEMLAGMLGFFTFMAFLQAIILEFRGDNAVGAALLLAVLAALLYWVLRKRRSLNV